MMEKVWDEALRYDYQLTKDSVVFDVGGFEGTWAYNIYEKYQSHIYVFEPVIAFYRDIKTKCQAQKYVEIYNWGLGSKDERVSLSVEGMSTSILSKSEDHLEFADFKDVAPILSAFKKIDLIKLNIEGAEYDLLDYIIEKGLQSKLINIQVQFHMNIPDYENRRQKIREELAKTHHLTYDFAYTHENWELNK